MKSISIDDKKYSKATDIARELGYTADYVGQLCRAGKVDAQLVGRSWYVCGESIRAHKKTRYRNDKKATEHTIAESLETTDLDGKESFSVPLSIEGSNTRHGYAAEKFYARSPQKSGHSYFEDESELIPSSDTRSKTGKLSVEHADAQRVKIKSTSPEYNFDPTPRPKIRFSGALSISEAETEEPVDEPAVPVIEKDVLTQKIHVHTKEKKTKQRHLKGAKTVKVRHLRKDTKKKHKNLPTEHNDEGIIGMRALRISDRNPEGGTLKVAVPSGHESVSSFGTYVITASVVASIAISVLVIGLESVVEVSESQMVTSYFFEIQELIAAASFAW